MIDYILKNQRVNYTIIRCAVYVLKVSLEGSNKLRIEI